jgi:hypothetical protein
MKKATDTPDIVKLFHTKKPKTLRAITRLGFSLNLIGIGLYRNVYRIVDTDYIVKLPKNADPDGIEHAKYEYDAQALIRSQRKYRILWKYMPDVSYYDETAGITLMPYYKPVDIGTKQARQLGCALAGAMLDVFKLVWKVNPGRSLDIHDGNIGLTKDGMPVMIDMGYFLDPNQTIPHGNS